MVGVIDDVTRRCTAGFRDEGDLVALVGPVEAELDGSEYQRIAHGVNAGLAPSSISTSSDACTAFVLDAIAPGLLHSAHDCAEGGIAIALADRVCWAT